VRIFGPAAKLFAQKAPGWRYFALGTCLAAFWAAQLFLPPMRADIA
jgi:hypothetical protein